MLTPNRIFWPFLVLALSSYTAATAQTLGEDQGVLRVFQDGGEIAREEFSITRAGTDASGSQGVRLAASVAYPPRRTQLTLTRRIDFGADSEPQVVQFDSSRPGARRVLAQFGARRLTIRTISPAEESAQEHPKRGRYLVVDDSSFSLYAVAPGLSPGPVTLFWVREGRGESFQLESRGAETTTVEDRQLVLTHLILQHDNDTRHLWYDDQNRLMKVEIPSKGIVAERTTATAR